MTGHAAIVLQARMNSTRLPGKALADLEGRSVLGHCVTRLSVSGLPVIVATTTGQEDDAIAEEAARHGADVFRGDSADVIGRFIAAAERFQLTEIVRATADNPAVDLTCASRVLELRRRVCADHVVECGLPIGGAVEAITLDALMRARDAIVDPYDREHVTSFMRRDLTFRAMRAVAPGHLRRPGLRLTIDTHEDLEFMQSVFANLDGAESPAPLGAIIQSAESLLVRSVRKTLSRKGA